MNKRKRVSHWNKVLFLSIIVTVIVPGGAGMLYAQVNQGELEQNLGPVTFINYEGPHARIETREQIRQIGAGLGQAMRGGAERSGGTGRYFVIHSVSAPDGAKLDADIFGLGVDVGVDHIRNLRTIIQGYLQEAYGYSASDAGLLAEYITIYNAVYRGNWDYFTSRYKTAVLDNLTRERAGLSIRFDEWPGRTLMLIPLGIGDLSAIDTTTISDSRVIEEMRKEDDKGVEQRKDMVDLKEREAAQAEQKAALEREAIKEDEQKISQEQSRIDQERQQIAQERQQAQERQGQGQQQGQGQGQGQGQQGQGQQGQGSAAPGTAAAGAETQGNQGADQTLAELDQREQAADQKQAELDQRQAELEAKREEAQKLDDFATAKHEEAQQDRLSIASDQQAGITQTATSGVIGAMLESSTTTLGRLVRLDPKTGQILTRSPLNTLSVRTLTFIGGKIIAVAGESAGGGAIRLVELNGGTLTMAKQGEDDIHPGTLIWVNGSDLYAITMNKNNNTINLGRFDGNLSLQAKSQINVHPNATVTIQQGNLLTQKPDGSAALLNPMDLTEIKR